MLTEHAEKIKFMECRMMGTKEKFVVKLDGGQYMFQVLEFADMEQYHAFAEANAKTHAPYIQVGSRMVALRFSGNLQHVTITQDNASQVAQGIIAAEKEAAKWYDEFLKEKEEQI